MDSINIIKGYNKVNHTQENQPPPPHKSSTTTTQKRFSTAATVAAILFLTFFIGLMLAALIHESTTEPPESSTSSSSLSSNLAESIKTVCGVTQYPDSCFTSISSLNNNNISLISQKNPDPETIFKLSLRVNINELTNVSSLFKTLNERHSEAALRDCTSQFEDAVSRLNDSLSEMEVGSGEKMLTERKVNDIQTWISAAMTDQETCSDGLEEMGSTAVDEVKAKLKKSKEFLSNSLAIIAKIHMLLHKFDLTMH